MKRPLLIALAVAAALAVARAGEPETPGGAPHRVHALIHATVVPRPGERIDDATVVIRDGVFEAVGADVVPPADARVWDMTGRVLYPGLIEPYLPLGVDAVPAQDGKAEAAGASPAGARHPNPAVRAERRAALEVALSPERLRALRRAGFTAALVVPDRGVFRGTSALVTLRDGRADRQAIASDVAAHVAFEAGSWKGSYPGSLMGAVALVRQTLLDAEHQLAAWDAYGRAPLGHERPRLDASLTALAPVLQDTLPVCVAAEDAQAALRAAAVLREFELVPWLVLGRADVGRWLDELVETAAPLIVSLNAPPAPRWDDPDQALDVETEALRRWYLAPEGPAQLAAAGARFAFTAHGLANRDAFRARIRDAIERGLSPDAALAALTTAPAALLRAPQLGVIAPGAIANVTIADDALFAEHTRIVEVWVDGDRYAEPTPPPGVDDVAGRWRLEVAGARVQLKLIAKKGELTAQAAASPADASGEPAWVDTPAPVLWRDRLTLTLPAAVLGRAGDLTLEARVDGRQMRARWGDGPAAGEVALLGRQEAPSPKDEDADGQPEVGPGGLAIDAWGPWPPGPAETPSAVLFRNATVWTQGPQGVLEGASLLVRGGRIAAVGYDLQPPPGALVIDAAGRHLTPGLIDCHSHAFATGALNEGTHACTAEVRVADVIDAETINIYRQLAGGVTTANLLHGSANPIGGQSAVLQLRWRSAPSALLLEGAPPGIKFALGENPKRSNWGEGLKPRYPTSRMGVRESIRERLLAARDYAHRLDAWRREQAEDPNVPPPRIDLQLEALVEVLNGERRVHCHCYRQDEILAMIRLAEELGFTVGTFQHVLEGYKIADEIAAHGAGASTFSDWWAYKFEVYDAIAYNGALMHRRGVTVSFNSDSPEMARRLNQEAGKAIRYGGLSEPEALGLVTDAPARQLGIDRLTGSLEVGKQADLVLWSDRPLQPTALCDETWIGGRRYYSRELDAVAYRLAEQERALLLKAARVGRRAPDAVDPTTWKPTFARPAHAAQATCCHEEE